VGIIVHTVSSTSFPDPSSLLVSSAP
jgi:hypothetical protein